MRAIEFSIRFYPFWQLSLNTKRQWTALVILKGKSSNIYCFCILHCILHCFSHRKLYYSSKYCNYKHFNAQHSAFDSISEVSKRQSVNWQCSAKSVVRVYLNIYTDESSQSAKNIHTHTHLRCINSRCLKIIALYLSILELAVAAKLKFHLSWLNLIKINTCQ